MRDRGESFVEILFRALGRSLATQSTSPVSTFEAEMIAALFASDRDLRLKRLLAQQLVNTDLGALWQGPDGSTIITERNKRALEVLQRELQSGKKRIAVFYGAGHTPDLHQRLVKDFGLKPVRTRWLTAWNLMADKGLNGK